MPGGGAVVVEPLMGRGGGAGMNGNPGWVRGRGLELGYPDCL